MHHINPGDLKLVGANKGNYQIPLTFTETQQQALTFQILGRESNAVIDGLKAWTYGDASPELTVEHDDAKKDAQGNSYSGSSTLKFKKDGDTAYQPYKSGEKLGAGTYTVCAELKEGNNYEAGKRYPPSRSTSIPPSWLRMTRRWFTATNCRHLP